MFESVDEIYEQVSSKISREEFDARLEEKKNALGGLCDDAMCARIVANDLGFSSAPSENNGPVEIGDIKEDSGNVSFRARVLNVYEPREFTRNDGTIGRVANVFVGDSTGRIRISVWDDQVELIRSGQVKQGTTVTVSGNTKAGLNGVEVHVGNNGLFAVSDEEVIIASTEKKIGEIDREMSDVSVCGKILEIGPVKTFTRKDGREGKVSNMMIGDETRTIRLTLWDEKSELANELRIGESIQVMNGYARFNNFSKKIEISVGSMGSINKLDREVDYKMKFVKISEITDGMNGINLSARILDISDARSFIRKDGSEGHIGNFIVGDETGKIRLTLWDDKTEYLDEFDFDETVDIINAYAKVNNFSQAVEINIGSRGTIKPSTADVVYQEKMDKLADILPGRSYSVQARVVEIGDLREFEREDGTRNAVANIEIEDETGSMRVALWGEHAAIVNDLQPGMEIRFSDIFSKFGMNETIELSAGNRTKITIL